MLNLYYLLWQWHRLQVLSTAVAEVSVKGVLVQAVVDTRSSIFHRQCWKIEEPRSSITMAPTNLKTYAHGHCCDIFTKIPTAHISNLLYCTVYVLMYFYVRISNVYTQYS